MKISPKKDGVAGKKALFKSEVSVGTKNPNSMISLDTTKLTSINLPTKATMDTL